MKWAGILTFSKDYVIPVVVGFAPFFPSVYSYVTEPDLHFVYEVENERNPVEEWNRQIGKMFKRLDPHEQQVAVDAMSAPLLRRIGTEIYKALPALLAGAGVRPMEASVVKVLNVSNEDLRDIRVHFAGCSGFDSYLSWPDSIGSPSNPGTNSPKAQDAVTLRYDRLPPSVNRVESQAELRYYGERTADCKPTVEATTASGRPAIGKRMTLEIYRHEATWDRYNREQRAELLLKVGLALGLIFVYIQVRRLQKRLDQSTSQ